MLPLEQLGHSDPAQLKIFLGRCDHALTVPLRRFRPPAPPSGLTRLFAPALAQGGPASPAAGVVDLDAAQEALESLLDDASVGSPPRVLPRLIFRPGTLWAFRADGTAL